MRTGSFRKTGNRMQIGLALIGAVCSLLTVIASAANSEHADPTRIGRDAAAETWVLAGQSNMQGESPVPSGGDSELSPDPGILMLNLDNTWQVAAEPLHRHYEATQPIFRKLYQKSPDEWQHLGELSRRGKSFHFGHVGPGFFFAKRLHESLVRPIRLIPCAFGGLPIERWNPALKDQGGESLYGAMLERIRFAGGHINGVLWYQGESDALDPQRAKVYEERLLDLVDSLRRDTGIDDLPFLFVQLAGFAIYESDNRPVESLEMVREAQRRATGKRRNLFMTSAVDLPLSDHAHLAYGSQKRLGRRLAEIALTSVYHESGHASSIDFQSADVVSSDTSAHATPSTKQGIRVKFTGVYGKLTSSGRPAVFDLRSTNEAMSSMPIVYRVDIDGPECLLHLNKPLTEPANLVYGGGLLPQANLCDSLDTPVPAFGPIKLRPPQ